MEQLPAMSTVFCGILLIFTWGQAAVEIPVGCKSTGILNARAPPQKPGGLSVSQQPRSLSVTAGQAMTLKCTFEYKKGMKAKVLWLRGSEEVMALDSNHPFYQRRMNVSGLDAIMQGEVTLILSKVEERDTGFYRCCIEIYNNGTGMGGGTELSVMQRSQTLPGNKTELQCEPSTKLAIYKAVIAVAGVGIILLVGALVLCRQKAATRDTQLKEPSKKGRRCASDPSEDLHYAEITVTPPTQIHYASVRTKKL